MSIILVHQSLQLTDVSLNLTHLNLIQDKWSFKLTHLSLRNGIIFFTHATLHVHKCSAFFDSRLKTSQFCNMDQGEACQQTILLTPPTNRRFAWVLYPDHELYFVQSTGRGMVNILSIKFSLPQYLIFINCLRSVAPAPHGYSLVLDVTNITSMTLIPDFGRTARTLNIILLYNNIIRWY